MKIYKIRGLLYKAAKYLGDFTAIKKAFTQKSIMPVLKRIARRIYGKVTSRGFNFFK